MRPSPQAEGHLRPLALGYIRLHAGDQPEVAVALTAEMVAYADKEHLALADVFTDTFDPPTGDAERAGFCALMDALRRDDSRAVIIPTPEHLSRRLSGFLARRTIIETEAGARLLIVPNTYQLP